MSTAQMSRLRGLTPEFCSIHARSLPAVAPEPGELLVLSHEQMARLGPAARRVVRSWVEAGTILYLRGGAASGNELSLEPFVPHTARIRRTHCAAGYRIAAHPMVPRALRGEITEGRFSIPSIDATTPALEPILLSRDEEAAERPAIFAIRCGSGAAIYDLHSDDDACVLPIVERLASPALRPANLGALVAADAVAGRDLERPAAFNLTLDDRPANFDLFNVANLRQLLSRVRERLPNGRVDFAWTPNQARVSRRYVQTMNEFQSGFVWHGFLRHVDHRSIANPEVELAEGKRMVQALSRRFGIIFQPIMVFPFERDSPACVDLLRRNGFRAKVESIPPPWAAREGSGDFLDYSGLACENGHSKFAVLHRKAVERMDRDWMIAAAALGLPVMAVAHPEDFGLKRFARNPWRSNSYEELDRVLDFAAEKSLRPISVAEIAEEAIAA